MAAVAGDDVWLTGVDAADGVIADVLNGDAVESVRKVDGVRPVAPDDVALDDDVRGVDAQQDSGSLIVRDDVRVGGRRTADQMTGRGDGDAVAQVARCGVAGRFGESDEVAPDAHLVAGAVDRDTVAAVEADDVVRSNLRGIGEGGVEARGVEEDAVTGVAEIDREILRHTDEVVVDYVRRHHVAGDVEAVGIHSGAGADDVVLDGVAEGVAADRYADACVGQRRVPGDVCADQVVGDHVLGRVLREDVDAAIDVA